MRPRSLRAKLLLGTFLVIVLVMTAVIVETLRRATGLILSNPPVSVFNPLAPRRSGGGGLPGSNRRQTRESGDAEMG